jgi:DNA-3-methyladenine glycosylase II
MTMQAFTMALPQDYRSADVLAFHARDAEGLAEQVSGQRIRKAVLLGGVPVLFDVLLTPHEAQCRIAADGELDAATLAAAHDALRSILALRIDPALFADFAYRLAML